MYPDYIITLNEKTAKELASAGYEFCGRYLNMFRFYNDPEIEYHGSLDSVFYVSNFTALDKTNPIGVLEQYDCEE